MEDESDCKENDRKDDSCHLHSPKLFAAHSKQQDRRHAQVQNGNDNRDLERPKKAQQHDAGQDSTQGGASGLH